MGEGEGRGGLKLALSSLAWKNGWQLISPKKSFAVFAATPTEKAEWMAHINKCIVDLLARSKLYTRCHVPLLVHFTCVASFPLFPLLSLVPSLFPLLSLVPSLFPLFVLQVWGKSPHTQPFHPSDFYLLQIQYKKMRRGKAGYEAMGRAR